MNTWLLCWLQTVPPNAAAVLYYIPKGWKGRWNCRCIRCHYAVTPSLLDTFTAVLCCAVLYGNVRFVKHA